MAQKLAICTHKGGTGKTVTSLALAAGLAKNGQRTLLIDLDPQGHSTIGLGIELEDPTLKDFFARHPSVPLKDVIKRTPVSDNLDVAPSDLPLAWTAEGLSARPKKEELLKRSLRQADEDYEWILMDTPPSLGVLTQNAVTAADYVLIPTLAEARAKNAITDLLDLIRLLRGDSFDNYRILFTRMDARKTTTNAAVMGALEAWNSRVLETQIPQSEALNQAQIKKTDIYSFAGKSTGALAYTQLIKELTSL